MARQLECGKKISPHEGGVQPRGWKTHRSAIRAGAGAGASRGSRDNRLPSIAWQPSRRLKSQRGRV